MNVYQVLTGARGRLANGWCKGMLKISSLSGSHQFCAVGAILDAAGEEIFYGDKGLTHAAIAAVEAQVIGHWDDERILTDENHVRWMRVVHFNNSPDTHKGDVLAAFDRAIAHIQPAKAVIAQAQNTDLITDLIKEEIPA